MDAEAGLVNVSFSSSLFLATKKQPDFYQIIVTEGRSGVVVRSLPVLCYRLQKNPTVDTPSEAVNRTTVAVCPRAPVSV